MVEPTQHGNGDHLGCLLRCRNRTYWRLRNPLPKPLMGSGLLKVEEIRSEEAMELLLLENEEVIQAFSPHTAQKTFTERIREGAFDLVFEAP